MKHFFCLILVIIFSSYSIAKTKNSSSTKASVLSSKKQESVPNNSLTEVKAEVPIATIPLDIQVLAKQAILVDYHTGNVLLQKNAEVPMAPSSMTKIMTAYLAIEKMKAGVVKPDTIITVGKDGWRAEGSSMFLNINDQVSVIDLLKGIIIQSGNDASITLASALSGSEEAFAAEMTRRAHEMGATQTNFKNSSGLPMEGHFTTPKDLIIMALHTINDHPEYYHLYSQKEFTYGKITQGNRNPLLYKNIGCDGIKTGHAEEAGYGMVTTCIQQGQRLLLVINGLPSMQARADEATKLITWGMRTFSNVILYKHQQLVDQIPVWYGREDLLPITVEKDAIVTLPRINQKNMQVKLQYHTPIAAPITKGTEVGKIIVTSSLLTKPMEFPLVAAVTIEKAGFFKQLKDSIAYLIWGVRRNNS